MGVGIDIVEIKRLNLKQQFLAKFLSTNELKRLAEFESDERKLQFAAGRWAVKEALIKATNEQIIPSHIDIGYKNNKPVILNLEFNHIHISISHEQNYAVGLAIAL